MILPGLRDPTRGRGLRGFVVTAFPVLRYPAHGLTIARLARRLPIELGNCELLFRALRDPPGRNLHRAFAPESQRLRVIRIDSDIFISVCPSTRK